MYDTAHSFAFHTYRKEHQQEQKKSHFLKYSWASNGWLVLGVGLVSNCVLFIFLQNSKQEIVDKSIAYVTTEDLVLTSHLPTTNYG